MALARRRSDDAHIQARRPGSGDQRLDRPHRARRHGVAVGEQRPGARRANGFCHTPGESFRRRRRQDRQDQVGLRDGGLQAAGILHVRSTGQPHRMRAAAAQIRDDSVTGVDEHPAHGTAHVTGADDGDRCVGHPFNLRPLSGGHYREPSAARSAGCLSVPGVRIGRLSAHQERCHHLSGERAALRLRRRVRRQRCPTIRRTSRCARPSMSSSSSSTAGCRQRTSK